MTSSAAAARRHAWLELIQQSGPFLTVPVADETWPSGIPAVPQPVRTVLRVARHRAARRQGRQPARARAASSCATRSHWGDALVEGADMPAALTEIVAEHGVVLRPDFAFYVADAALDDDADVHDDDDDDTDDDDEDRRKPTRTTASRRLE